MRKRFPADVTKKLKEKSKSLPVYSENPDGTFMSKIKFLWCDNKGKVGKRAFFFSLSRLLAVFYAIVCIIRIDMFNAALATFISGLLAETGINYYKNEARKDLLPTGELTK